MAYFKTKFTSENDSNFNVDLESESDAYEAGKKASGSGGAVDSVNGKTGDVVLTASDVGAYSKEETNTELSLKADKAEIPTVPKKISQLTDDTGVGLASINYAKQAMVADSAYTDGYNNIIKDTYATKSEAEDKSFKVDKISASENLDSEHYPSVKCLADEVSRLDNSIPQKLSELTDDTEENMIEHARNSIWSSEAMKAWQDENENNIVKTYATKSELAEAIGEALEGDY